MREKTSEDTQREHKFADLLADLDLASNGLILFSFFRSYRRSLPILV